MGVKVTGDGKKTSRKSKREGWVERFLNHALVYTYTHASFSLQGNILYLFQI